MRFGYTYITITLLVVAAIPLSCAPGLTDTTGGSVIDAVADVVTNAGDGTPPDGTPSDADTEPATPPATAQSQIDDILVTGRVGEKGDYQLFELDAAQLGDEWTITAASNLASRGYFLVVLFDEDYELLYRRQVTSNYPLRHILRGDTSRLYAGVTPSYSSGGGDFTFEAARRTGLTPAAPCEQVVWINFGPGSDVKVHNRDPLSFPSLDAAMLGAEYEGTTAVLKEAIVAAVREDYVAYNLVITTSDEGPPPSTPYSTIHVGGNDSRLLGLADNVDQYNTDLNQTAVVYVEAFADFSVMRLTPEEMGQMIGNVVSHELGHLLGLYHTTDPVDVMDTTGTAWDLAANQGFIVGPLEPTVFPYGYENSPERLAETLGCKPGYPKDADVTKHLVTAKMMRKAELRAIVRDELRCRCGNCLNPDE